MIIVDYSQIMISNLMQLIGNHKNAELSEDLLRHMILNSLRMYRMKFGKDYGELVIACDDKNYWRRELYPHYKANRRKNRDDSELDWNLIFQSLNRIRDELKEFFPYKVIHVDHAEADDIIGTLAKVCHYDEDILILSGDKDFQQLQQYYNVKQFSPVLKKFLDCKNPELFLREHILRGDQGDGIPNFLSADDVFVTEGARQTPMQTKKVDVWIKKSTPEEFCDAIMLRNYKRNQELIDLNFIPTKITDEIMKQFGEQNKDRSKLFNYFIQYKLKNLMESIQEF